MAAREAAGIDPADERLYRFARIVEDAGLHGLAFQHLALCARRAWLHLSRIDYAHLDRRMTLGTVSHDLHRTRDRSTTGLMGLAPDRIDWTSRRVHEAKGGAGAKDAVSLQTGFYALMLTAASGEAWGGGDGHPARAAQPRGVARRRLPRADARDGGEPRRAA